MRKRIKLQTGKTSLFYDPCLGSIVLLIMFTFCKPIICIQKNIFTICSSQQFIAGSILRSDIAAESRAKIVYEYLMQFTDDKDVLATLNFLMTREVAHFQQFEAALDTIQPNFPPGVLQSDPRYSNIYSNHSMGEDARGPWNEGESIGLGEEWLYVENPRQQVLETDGLTELEPQGTPRTEASVRSADKKLSKQRSSEIRKATPEKNLQWSQYDSQDTKAPRRQPVGQD